VLKPKTHCYVMVSYGGVWDLKSLIEAETDFIIPKSLIWDKVSIGMGYNYRAQHEHILFCKKGKRPVNNRGLGDVLRFKRVHPTHATWPTAKPIDMLRVLVTQSTEPGDLILDPFLGSGATGVAALVEGREFLGCDIMEEAVELSRKALRDCATIRE
jgi:site-specific DNA-methyltransferase (adenine-specific)